MIPSQATTGLPYLVHVPPVRTPHRLLLFLHGKGESGQDLGALARHSLGAELARNPDKWPFLVVIPQKSDPNSLWPELSTELSALLNDLAGKHELATDGHVAMGLSQGGHGALALPAGFCLKFDQVVSFCGWGEPRELSLSLTGKRVWLFHGQRDMIVPCQASLAVHDNLVACGIACKLTLYPRLGHNCWDTALAEPALSEWLVLGNERAGMP